MVHYDGAEDNTFGPDDRKAYGPWPRSQTPDAKLLMLWAISKGPSFGTGRRPSVLHRYSGSCGVLHLNGSLCIKTTGSRSSIEKPESDSRHLHAGHRLGGIQDNPQTYPGDTTHLRFRCHVLVHDESAVVHLRSSF